MNGKEILATLKLQWPEWHIWHVPCYPDPDRWCARRWDETGPQLSTNSPDALERQLEDADQ